MHWPWKTKAVIHRDFDAEWEELNAWDKRAEHDGFRMWEYEPPQHGSWIECRRREWNTSQVWQENGGSPLMNVRGLWWRPWTGETIEGAVIDAKALPQP